MRLGEGLAGQLEVAACVWSAFGKLSEWVETECEGGNARSWLKSANPPSGAFCPVLRSNFLMKQSSFREPLGSLKRPLLDCEADQETRALAQV